MLCSARKRSIVWLTYISQSRIWSPESLIVRRSAVKSCEAYEIKAFKLTDPTVPRKGWVRAVRRRRGRSMIECVGNWISTRSRWMPPGPRTWRSTTITFSRWGYFLQSWSLARTWNVRTKLRHNSLNTCTHICSLSKGSGLKLWRFRSELVVSGHHFCLQAFNTLRASMQTSELT